MRTKDEILADSLNVQLETPQSERIAAVHEHLTIEVLIDIRDILEEFRQTQKYFLQRSSETD